MADLPLKGIRVVDMGRIYAGPTTGKILADMGAEVIKVESIQRLDLPNRKLCFPENEPNVDSYNHGGWFHWLNSNKKSITLDLNKPQAVEAFKRLVKISDVILENFSPRVMMHFGLDYDVLKKVKPDIIMVSLSGYGHSGPYRDRPAYAWAFEGISGFQSVTGYYGGQPMIVGTGYGDWILGMSGVNAIMLALLHRSKSGEGQYINVAGQEVVLHSIGEMILEYSITGKVPKPMGNRHGSAAPQGCYRCQGDDKWIAITVSTEDEWKSFCKALSNPPWTKDERFTTIQNRWQNQDELDKFIEEWTQQQDYYQAMHILQKEGVPAAAVLSNSGILLDEQFRTRGFFQMVDQPGAGARPMPRLLAARFSQFESPTQPAPLLGEHNREILEGFLGFSPSEIEEMEKEKTIGTEPIGHGEIKDRGFNIPFVTKIGSASFDAEYLQKLKKYYNIKIPDKTLDKTK